MEDINPVSHGTIEALNGLKKFLKHDKSTIPYKRLDVNLYTIARNVVNDKRFNPKELTGKELTILRESMMTELAYLNNVLTIDIFFYLPELKNKKEDEEQKKKVTKSMLNKQIAISLAKHVKTKVRLRKPVTGSIILTNCLAGIVELNNPILRSFTGEVIFKQEYYKLLKRAPPVKVTRKILRIFGDDFVDGMKGKAKEINKLLTLIKESPFKPKLEITNLINTIIEG